MVRGLALAALTLLAGGAEARGRQLIDRYGGGGTLTSPDGRWRITAPPAPGRDDRYTPASAYLHGPGVRRHLLDYSRLLDADWPSDGQHVLLTLIDLDGEFLEVHSLGSRETGHPRRMMAGILRQMKRIPPLLEQADVQHLAFGNTGGAECVLVAQDGTPAGIREGSFVTRTAAFRLDLGHERAIRIPRCPGAKLS